MVYLLDILLFIGLCLRAAARPDPSTYAWTWLFAWFLFGSTIVLLASFFGDANAFRRHLYPSVESFRLLMWLLVIVYADGFLDGGRSTRQGANTQLESSTSSG